MDKIDFTSLKKAINSFQKAVDFGCSSEGLSKLNNDQQEIVKAGVIQNFEFTYEISWKFMKRWLESNVGSTYVDGVTRKELFRLAAEHHLIKDVKQWIIYHDARNETVHTYNQDTAQEVFEIAIKFVKDVNLLLKVLESKND